VAFLNPFSDAVILPFKIDIFLAGMLLAESCHEGGGPLRSISRWRWFSLPSLSWGKDRWSGWLSGNHGVRILLTGSERASACPSRQLRPQDGGNSQQQPFPWLGEISYSTYLLHLPIMAPVLFHNSPLGHNIPASTLSSWHCWLFQQSSIRYPGWHIKSSRHQVSSWPCNFAANHGKFRRPAPRVDGGRAACGHRDKTHS